MLSAACRSRAGRFAVSLAVMTSPTPLPAIAHQRYSPIVDQNGIGSATGCAGAGLMGSAPFSASAAEAAPYDYDYAVALYSGATRRDTLAGYYPPSDTGSSLVAVAKELHARGAIGGYVTGTTVEALLEMLQSGPVMVGTVWLSYMDRPTALGFVRISGSVMGGHAYLCREYAPDGADPENAVLTFDNCWGTAWGPLGGRFKMRVRDMRSLCLRGAELVGATPPGSTPAATPNVLIGA